MTDLSFESPLRVVVLFSGGASGVRYLEEHDPAFGDAYEVVGGFSDDPGCVGVERLREAGVPVETNDLRAFYDERGADRDDLTVREAFDAETRDRIAGFDPDVVLLSGYMWILTEPIVGAFPVVNVHPADLALTDESGEPVYVGADPVFDAIAAGEDATRSSVHFVTTEVDAGPVLVRSRAFPVHRELVSDLTAHGADDGLRDYTDAHQEWMKWEGDGPAIAAALSLLSEGRVARDGDVLSIDGEPGPLDLARDREET